MEAPKRECIQIVPYFQRKTAETSFLDSRLQKNLVSRICVIRPSNVFYTLLDSSNRKLYCCLATRDNATLAGKPIFGFKRSIIEIINLSYDGHIRVGVLTSDGLLHILLLEVANRWEKTDCVSTGVDISQFKDIAYSRIYNSLFWPVANDDDTYAVYCYNIKDKTKRLVLGSVPTCTLQVKNDALVVLFNNHGVLFAHFKDLFPSECEESKFKNPDVFLTNYWNPGSTEVITVQSTSFEAMRCKSALRSYCLSHDRRVVYALYGNTLYALNGTACSPLTTLEVPEEMVSINLMFLGRITVLQSEEKTVAYLNSSKPVKTLNKRFRFAGFGFVWDDSGLFQIRMCNPQETPEEFQNTMMGAYTPAYRAAISLGRAVTGNEMPCAPVDYYSQLATPNVVCIAAAYAQGQENQNLYSQATQAWTPPENWKNSGTRTHTMKRLENCKKQYNRKDHCNNNISSSWIPKV